MTGVILGPARRGLKGVVMRKSRSRRCAGALVAVLAATLFLPLAALARSSAPAAEPHGCHCPVKMACCEAGLCHGDMDPEPSTGPSWSGCRDEAPDRTAVPVPPNAFDGALLAESSPVAGETGAPISFVAPAGAGISGPAPGDPSSPNLHRPLLTARGSSPAPPGAPRGTVARSSLAAPRWSTHEAEDLRPSRPAFGTGPRVGVRSGDALGLDPRHRRERTSRRPRHRARRRDRITARRGRRFRRTGPLPRSRAPRGDVPAPGRAAGLRDPDGRERPARSRRAPRSRRDASSRRDQGKRHGRQPVAPRRRRGRGDPRELRARRRRGARPAPGRLEAPQGGHRQRRRRPRLPEPRPERPRRRRADLRRLPEPHGPALLPRRLRPGRPRRGGQGPVRREEPGEPRRRREHRHATARAGLPRHRERRRRVLGLRQPLGLGLLGRRVVLGPRRVLLSAVRRRSRTATAAASPS